MCVVTYSERQDMEDAVFGGVVDAFGSAVPNVLMRGDISLNVPASTFEHITRMAGKHAVAMRLAS